jgi:hypothetical protein
MKRASFFRLRRLAVLTALGLMTLGLGCERIAPVRTLPNWVRGIYIPVFHNDSYEPAIEEDVTRLTQEAFLNDGRLSIVGKADADAMLVARIVEWQDESFNASNDKVTSSRYVIVKASVKLCEPFDEKRVIADLGEVNALGIFNSDVRSVRYQSEPDRKQVLLAELANQIVQKTINGFPAAETPLGTTPPPATSPGQIFDRNLLKNFSDTTGNITFQQQENNSTTTK